METQVQQHEEEDIIRSYAKKRVLPKHLDVDEEDAVTLLSLVVKIGIINSTILSENLSESSPTAKPRRFELKEEAFFDCEGPSRTNGSDRKRITYIRIGRWDTPVWDFQAEEVFGLLSRIEYLETLCVDRCRSFCLTETLSRFPNLKRLEAACYHTYGITILPHDTGDIGIDDRDPLLDMETSYKLESVRLSGFAVSSEADLGIFLFDIFPFLPKLTTFCTQYNNLKSLQYIAQRVRENKFGELQKANRCRLRLLDLGELYKQKQMKAKFSQDPNEIEAIKTILSAFRELNNFCGFLGLESCRECYEYLHTDIAYQMELNYIGRKLVEVKEEEKDSTTHITSVKQSSPIPLSLWPNILTREWKKNPRLIIYRSVRPDIPSEVSPDGIYYLLRNVWALQEGRSKRNDFLM
eukprot:CAMPEP_0116125646 /NCGR_PEP_ID=MMETSP0329-20121206/5919_1 /TAXON_ID=697910 /ORGANISM="Pseudo-nitzschia arenysensis, Strain B593" /LENGTH=408 /DNA_ID=CAMNT_0003619695 /DNA_START=1618 /DNA_END=2844 /DNA_ORIENTATION=-